MLLGCIADDFTGAGDIANTLSAGGMRTRLFVGGAIDNGAIDGADCDAGVVALKTRSIAPAHAVAQSLGALDRLRAAGATQIVFKYCSTFDSTPRGNIGPVAEALAEALGSTGVIVCPSFPRNGRTVYQGHLFVGDVLLSQSGMAHHPLTPMTDPDIRRWLALQTRGPVGHVDLTTVRAGSAAIEAALADAGTTLVVVDAVDEADLHAIGRAARSQRLITGGSGVAFGLPTNFRDAGFLETAASAFAGRPGPALVLSGSCSSATRAQVAAYRLAAPSHEIDVARLLAGKPLLGEIESFIARHRDAAPMIFSSADPAVVAATQERHGPARSAEAVEALFGDIAKTAVTRGATRIVVAGGETSGAVVSALGIAALDLGPEIDPGVPALAARVAGFDIALALKSGKFGAPDFFVRALGVLGSGDG